MEGVSCGALLSTYQRTRVENVCQRLELTALAYLWQVCYQVTASFFLSWALILICSSRSIFSQMDQSILLDEMVDYGLEAIVVKVSSNGLLPEKHLGKTIQELRQNFEVSNLIMLP